MSSENLDRQTYVRLTQEQHQRLEQIAESQERTVSYMIRTAVEQFLNRRRNDA